MPRTKYANLRPHELHREIEVALQSGDESSYKQLLQEVLNRSVGASA
jgi:hypothetical protein